MKSIELNPLEGYSEAHVGKNFVLFSDASSQKLCLDEFDLPAVEEAFAMAKKFLPLLPSFPVFNDYGVQYVPGTDPLAKEAFLGLPPLSGKSWEDERDIGLLTIRGDLKARKEEVGTTIYAHQGKAWYTAEFRTYLLGRGLYFPFENEEEFLSYDRNQMPVFIDESRLSGHLKEAYEGFSVDRLLIDDLSFRIPPGAIVGVIGPNGAGKSTLFKMITGKETPDSGSIKIGQTVRIAAVDQMRDSLPNDKTVFEAVSEGNDVLQVGKFQMSSRAYIGRFNFKGGDQQKLVGALSGGERGRLHLAKTLLAGGNVLLLDEPSNDLDVETLRALEEALLEFAGCALVTSHDRWFLDRIATHILAFEGDSKVVFFDGNYNEYEADKRRRLGEAACQPKRLRFKPLKH